MPAVRAAPGGVLIDILVQPRASRVAVGPRVGDRIKVAVTAAPVDGEANRAVIDALAQALGVRRRAIEITAGETGRRKTVRVVGLGPAAAQKALVA